MDVHEVYATPAMQAATLTFLLTDVEGSTRLWQEEPDRMRRLIQHHDELMQSTLRSHGGALLTERGEGDSFFAAFASAGDALAAALDAQLRLRTSELKVRMAINTGEAGADYRGPAVNRTARLRAAGHGGQVLVSGTTASLVRDNLPEGSSLTDLGSHRLKDLLEPVQVFQLSHKELPEEFPPLNTLARYRHNLPAQLSSFVGREKEIERVQHLVSEHRLVTLTGPAGTGKTRLALQVAAQLVDRQADGAWFADLSSLTNADQIPGAIGAVFSVREQHGAIPIEAVAVTLADLKLLLILDNCEHLLGGVAVVVMRLLSVASGLHVLATSREPLRISGEMTFRVPTLAEAEAVTLFNSRAAMSMPAEDHAGAVEEICRRLDYIPLAIELAATRAATLGLAALRQRLDDRLRFLSAGSRTALRRQQTLRAAIDWSHDLLSAEEQAMFRRLGVFAGSFDLEAAEAMAPDLTVIELLPELVDKSLVMHESDEGGAVRYRLLDSLRVYALEKLEAAGELVDVRRRHLDHYSELGERAYRERRKEPGRWAARVAAEHANLAAALDFAAQHQPAQHLALAGSVTAFWKGTAHHSEGRRHLDVALRADAPMDAVRARAMAAAGLLAIWQNEFGAANGFLRPALDFWKGADDLTEAAICLDRLGWAHFLANELEAADTTFQEELRIARELGDEDLVAASEGGIVQVAVGLEDVERARPIALRYLQLGRRLGDLSAIHLGYHFLGDCALLSGESDSARVNYRESLLPALELYDPIEASFEIQGIAMAMAGLGRYEAALVLAAAVASLWKQMGIEIHVRFWDTLLDRYLGPAHRALGPGQAASAWAEGAALSLDRAVDYALKVAAD